MKHASCVNTAKCDFQEDSDDQFRVVNSMLHSEFDDFRADKGFGP
jgi:hypothetical protein